jgi:hypothetical protein
MSEKQYAGSSPSRRLKCFHAANTRLALGAGLGRLGADLPGLSFSELAVPRASVHVRYGSKASSVKPQT